MKPRVCILYTGGTIGMRLTPAGYAPEPGYFARLMEEMPEFRRAEIPEYTVIEYQPLLDSANMGPRQWTLIAQDIAQRYTQFDGFVVIHGTDTMAYTASVLPLLLEGLDKPVILTGSQLPLCHIRSDGRDNLITALVLICQQPIPEVCLCFGGRILRGCRATKTDAAGFAAFDSPNYPYLGTVGVEVQIKKEYLRPPTGVPLTVHALNDAQVGALRLFPGISAELVRNVLRSPLQGLILETYGIGNGPSKDTKLLQVLSEARNRGIVLVNCTQCLRGTVRSSYETGTALSQSGVLSGSDMTAEAALTKLLFLCSQHLDPAVIEDRMQQNLCGELTPLAEP